MNFEDIPKHDRDELEKIISRKIDNKWAHLNLYKLCNNWPKYLKHAIAAILFNTIYPIKLKNDNKFNEYFELTKSESVRRASIKNSTRKSQSGPNLPKQPKQPSLFDSIFVSYETFKKLNK